MAAPGKQLCEIIAAGEISSAEKEEGNIEGGIDEDQSRGAQERGIFYQFNNS